MHTFQYHVILEENMKQREHEENMKQTSMKQRESFHNNKYIRKMCVSNMEARARGSLPQRAPCYTNMAAVKKYFEGFSSLEAETHSPVDYKESTLTLGIMEGTP